MQCQSLRQGHNKYLPSDIKNLRGVVQISFAVDFHIDHKGMGPQHRPKTTVLSIRNGRIIRVWLFNNSKVIYIYLYSTGSMSEKYEQVTNHA